MGQQQTARQLKKKVYIIENLDCANCAASVERRLNAMPEIEEAILTFATKQLRITAENPDALLDKIRQTAAAVEPEVEIYPRTRSGKNGSAREKECGAEHGHEHCHDDSCSCGHTHAHEHHHDGSCSSEHTPAHSHDHGSSCGCGHTHEHEHHHGDSCSCGYTHEDEHHHNASCGCGQE